MLEDPRGIVITTECADAAIGFESALVAFLGQRVNAGALLTETLVLDPGMVVANCLAGFSLMAAARRELVPQAGDHLARAREAFALRGGTRREAMLIAALAAWHDAGDMWRAAELLDHALGEAPCDLLLMRLSHAIRFMLGDAVGMRLSIETVLPSWSADVPGYAYVLGCHAFALGETGEFARAERIGRKGVTLEPRDLWGGHAVAHAMGALERPREGVAWVAWLEPHMADGGCFVRHIHWHRALCHLKLGEPEMALDLYDTRIRDAPTLEVRDVLNAASLLWRLENAGMKLHSSRWDELADIAERRIGDHCWTFADVHYVLCLAGAARHEHVSAMLGSICVQAVESSETQSRVHAEVGLTAARAVAAAMRGDAGHATALFASVQPDLHRLGGSNAQRDLLRQMHERAERDAAGMRAQADKGTLTWPTR